MALSFIDAYNGSGFSVELVHRDSPDSPFYNPSESQTKRLTNAIQRSLNRVNHFTKNSASIKNGAQPPIIPNNGEYLMNISIGTPPFGLLAIVDTGSDLMWIQCKPCTNCYKQIDPLFDPKSSTTYRKVSCKSERCQSLDNTSCDDDGTCRYMISYADKSHSIGHVANETLSMATGSKTGSGLVSFPGFTFGCGHDNAGSFNEKGTGIVGLGASSVSLISQLDTSISGKFSYCLVPFSERKSSSKLRFGSEAVVSGAKSVSTPLSRNIFHPVFYYLTLEAITIGDKRLKVNGSSSSTGDDPGNIIIDSGTTLTLLPSNVYAKMESQVAKSIEAKPVKDPSGILSLCYNSTAQFKAPSMTMHFSNADLKLNDYNTFVEVAEGVVCLAFGANDDLAIYGNIAQAGFLVGYDLGKKTLTFLPTDCSKS
ncbi:aspartic proteinase CDR1-like [Tripterygium wilfordii]|uniref:Aspartic proteinase CDR1-like n=2 Tax=Tripterygium wilfordii TaxID=458696 RepID=A0A7J7DSK2_TRIWF|nr:aspartic proteinase CDR1-like [Tripterygium wilfordii]